MIRMQHLELAIRANVIQGLIKDNISVKDSKQGRKSCNNCKFFEHLEGRDEDGVCIKGVSNDLCGQYIVGSDNFYCSLYKGTYYGV